IFSGPEKRVFTRANRIYPICFEYPLQEKDDVTVELPNGWTVSSVPSPLDRDAKAAEYTLTVEDHNKEVHITRTLRRDLAFIPKETYPALQTFYQDVRSGDEKQVVLQPASVAAGK